MMKISFAAVSAGLGLFALVPMQGWTGTVNGIQAVVHDSVITRHEVAEMTAPALDTLRRQYAGQTDALYRKLAEVERNNLDELTHRQLILHDFKTSGYNLPESILDDLVEERIRTQYRDRRTMAKTLQSQGLTTERFRQRLRERFIVDAMRNKNVASEIIISPNKVQAWYDANKEQFKVEDQYKLRMIVFSRNPEPNGPNPQRLAQELLLKVKEGTPFTELATVYSQRSPRGDGSEWYERGQLRPELVAAVTNLKAGDTTEVVETPDAYYLVHVEEMKPAHTKPLSEVRTTIESNLTLEERSRLEKQWVDRLKKKTFVRYY